MLTPEHILMVPVLFKYKDFLVRIAFMWEFILSRDFHYQITLDKQGRFDLNP